MDRDVRCDPDPTSRLLAEVDNPVKPFGNKVVLELKFTGRFPDWFRELVHVFSLAQCSAAKYADGVAQLGEYRLQGANVPHAHALRAADSAAEPALQTVSQSKSQNAAASTAKMS
jgi:hypothetical protein